MSWLPLSFHRLRDALRRGDVGRAQGRFREAIDSYTEAMVLKGGDLTPDQEAGIRNSIALCYLDLGDPASAELVLEPVATLDAARILPATRGATCVVHGRIALTRGDYDQTIAHATRSFEILKDTGENELVARALDVRGHGHRQLGQIEKAREDYTDALAAARRAGNRHEMGLALANLGSLLWLGGRYGEARNYHQRAAEIHEACGSEPQLTRELFALAVDEFHAGDWAQCDALLLRVEERAARSGDGRLASATAILRARLLLVRGKDPRPALDDARAGAEVNEIEHDRILVDQISAEAATERGDWPEAARALERSFERARCACPEGQPAAESAWRLALAEEHAGDPSGRTLDLLQFAMETSDRHGYAATGAAAARAAAEVLANRGRMEDAREHAERAVSVFRELRLPLELGRTLVTLGRLVGSSVTDASTAPGLFREAARLFGSLGAEAEAARAEEGLAGTRAPGSGGNPGSDEREPFAEIVTGAESMEEARSRALRIAPSDIPVLVTGETGTGKELFARSIHRASKRREHPFLAVNCAALTETLLEAELFGHVKGAFTGATSARAGIFEAACGGTVFLDEIGKAPPALQAKLLRVLDTGEVRRVGGVEATHVNVRIVAATNHDLPDLVERGDFLPDLLYRLRGYEITVPPLRDRPGDVPLLFQHFAGRPATEAAMEVLETHDWPGNVREIRNVAESASFLTMGRGPVPRDALPESIRRPPRSAPVDLAGCVQDREKDALVSALVRASGNRSAAARALGISRQTLYTKMSKYGIEGRADAA